LQYGFIIILIKRKLKKEPIKTDTLRQLFSDLNFHLLNDEKPSVYLSSIYDRPEFKQYPFSMLRRLRSTEQSPVHHPEGNVWNHTLLVVDEAARRKHLSADAAAFMWSALLHDIGKPDATKVRKDKITAYNHDGVGEKLARQFLQEFTGDNAFIDRVAYLVRYHMHILFVVRDLPFKDMEGMKRHTDIHEVALLGLCDRLGRVGVNVEEEERQVRLFIELCAAGKTG